LAFGSVPGLFAFYWRWKLHETSQFSAVRAAMAAAAQNGHADTVSSPNKGQSETSHLSHSSSNSPRHNADKSSIDMDIPARRYGRSDSSDNGPVINPNRCCHGTRKTCSAVVQYFRVQLLPVFRHEGKTLIGTAGCWFILDITFYGNSLFAGILSFIHLFIIVVMNSSSMMRCCIAEVTKGMGLGEGVMAEAENSLYLGLMALPGIDFSHYHLLLIQILKLATNRLLFGNFLD
jgi:hypothetical protein